LVATVAVAMAVAIADRGRDLPSLASLIVTGIESHGQVAPYQHGWWSCRSIFNYGLCS
jgi:hypothetical protein